MKIQFSDLHVQHAKIEQEMVGAFKAVLKRGDYILGKDVASFQEEFADFCHSRYAVGVSSGTAALFLALISLGIKEGDEVIVPAFTYIASALAVSYTGAKPVFIDIEEDTYNLDVKLLRGLINPRTKAIIPVHLYGQPANMPAILEIARENNLKVIEDTAQAHGAKIRMSDGKWQVAGSLGDVGCFSFYPSKNLGALGDGGICVTNRQDIYEMLLKLRDYGRVSKYEHVMVGYNSRLDTLQAAILRIKLGQLNDWNKSRQAVAAHYNRFFKGVSGVITPYAGDMISHVYHIYAIRVGNRDEMHKKLKESEIDSIIHYPIPLPLQKAYGNLKAKKGDFPVCEKISSEILSLPMFPYMEEAQVEYVVENVKKYLA